MRFDDLPQSMQNPETKDYFEKLQNRRGALAGKRVFDIVVSALMLVILSPLLLLTAAAVKADSKGPVFYRQVRVGRYGRNFRIFKFRTMVQDADKKGLAITVGEDPRITRVGRLIRKCRLDEIAQLLNVLNGTMSFVGPRPEVPKYVDAYEDAYMATLLVRPGVTAPSSIYFRNEDEILAASDADPEVTYVKEILPTKMRLNLEYLDSISVWNDVKVMFQTVKAVF
ncbi:MULTISPECIES: sugar transferase [Caproicibacterium]|uniref:Sugar transferase n=1 Tax=Caproicibacterium argilliputei TaxID=3030016 RepID=A0AA97DAV4_9FIRM|nr:sugar transferase [Caproicibacterium argilliputei]WOC32994.1 sugar transferase [Caproicibacterium argilliputei]